MSNKLKTLSAQKLEELISGPVGEYLNEHCDCTVSDLSTPNIDSEDHIALHDQRTLNFNVELSYREE